MSIENGDGGPDWPEHTMQGPCVDGQLIAEGLGQLRRAEICVHEAIHTAPSLELDARLRGLELELAQLVEAFKHVRDRRTTPATAG